MPRSSHLVALALALTSTTLALAACGPATPPAAAPPGATPPAATPTGGTCAERTTRAAKEVIAVLNANLACTADADCVSTGVGSVCFDACSHAVSARGREAVRDASAKVDSTTCATFKQDGCRFDVPPCSPPSAPHCNHGKCE